MAAPDFRKYVLKNKNQADTIYPMIYDQTGKVVLWDGSLSSSNEVAPGEGLAPGFWIDSG